MKADSQQNNWYSDIVDSYDTVADLYAADYYDELSRKPFDRELLGRFAELIPKGGRVGDVGCGPGHIACFLSGHGVDAMGVDFSQSMVDTAKRLNPELEFERADMRRLPFADASFAGITAFYSLIHIERTGILEALNEMLRVLSPGGRLLIAFHAGEGEAHVEQYSSHGHHDGPKIALHVTFFGVEEMRRAVEAAGFTIEEALDREPYEFEYPSRRGYVLARKP